MSEAGSVSRWIGPLKAGDHQAAQQLWERYFHRLVGLARHKLQGKRRVADEEDAALSAFDSFCRGAERGRFPQLADRDDLWHLLVLITVRKASDLIRYERSQKRGGGTVPDSPEEMDLLPSDEPTPELAAQLAEEYRRLLDCLGDAELR